MTYLTRFAAFMVICGASPIFAQSFFDDFDDNDISDGMPVAWTKFETHGDVDVRNMSIVLTPTTGGCCFGAFTEFPHENVMTEAAVQFVTGADNTFFFTLLREDSMPGQYWAVVSPLGEIGIGRTNSDGSDFIGVRDVFLPDGPLASEDIVRVRTEIIGATITQSAWLDGEDPLTGATVSWTDPLNLWPTGDIVGFSTRPNDAGLSAEVVVHSFGATIVPEPVGMHLVFVASLGSLVLRRRKMRSNKTR